VGERGAGLGDGGQFAVAQCCEECKGDESI